MSAISNSQTGHSQTESRGDCSSQILFVILLGWIGLVTYSQNSAAFALSVFPVEDANRTTFLFSLGKIILLGLPLVALSWWWQNTRYRLIFQTWVMAVGFNLLLSPIQLMGQTAAQTQAILHILLAIVYSALIVVWVRKRITQDRLPPPSLLPPGDRSFLAGLLVAIFIAALIAYPWLALGALGSPLDTILQLLAALALGLASALLLDLFLIHPLLDGYSISWQNFILASLSAAATLLIIASGTGFSFGGMQGLLMLLLPTLGGALVGLAGLWSSPRFGETSLPMAVLIGLAAAAPMTFIDPDELALLFTAAPGEIIQWAFTAALLSAGIGSVFSFLFLLLFLLWKGGSQLQETGQTNWAIRISLPLLVSVVAAWFLAALIYVRAGQPGFYGEHMFVIMRDQADVSSAIQITDYPERRQYVFTTLVETANTTQAEIRQSLDRFNIPYTPYYLENAIDVVGNPILRIWLASRPEVDRVLESPRMRPLPQSLPTASGTGNMPAGTMWNLTAIGADRVWNELGVTGEGIVVGQSDSGVQGDHPELIEGYRGKGGQHDFNWLDPWNGTTTPTDTGGHGTHTLGTILGRQTGVAPGATWYGCVNLARNLGNPTFYLECMQFMLAPYPQDGDPLQDGNPISGAHVINNSWGCPQLEGCDPDSLEHAVRALRYAGVFVVASAGNEGPQCESIDFPPALFPDAYSVGAIDRSGQLAGFSSRGPVTADGSGRVKPDIIAPGVDVLSAYPGSTYQATAGTSMAGPHVVGVVALIWSANPALIGDVDRTEQIINATAQPYRGILPDCPGAQAQPSTAVGYGILDAYAAVQMAIQEGN